MADRFKAHGPWLEEIFARLWSAPEGAVALRVDGPHGNEATRRALARAGFKLEEYQS